MPSEDRATRCHLYGGDAPAEQHDEAVTVAGAKHAGVLGQRRNDMLGDLVRSGRAGFVIADVQVIATDQPHAQHNLRHGPHLNCAAGRQRVPRGPAHGKMVGRLGLNTRTGRTAGGRIRCRSVRALRHERRVRKQAFRCIPSSA